MKEVWKDIKGYEGLYQVSTFGRVISLPKLKNRAFGSYMSKQILLTPVKADTGYFVVNLYDKNICPKRMKIHRLVAATFITNHYNKKTVNHKNGIKTDNRIENLEWATHRENHLHAYANGLMIPSNLGKSGEDSLTHKTISQYTKSGEYLATFYSAVVAEQKTGISRKHICCVCNGNRKTTGGYIWKHV